MLAPMKKGHNYTIALLVLAHTALVNIVNAAFSIDTPTDSQECVGSVITWTEGVPPYTLDVDCELENQLHLGQSFLINEGTSAVWVPYGGISGCQDVLLQMFDSFSPSQVATSTPFLPAKGADSGCNGTLSKFTSISGQTNRKINITSMLVSGNTSLPPSGSSSSSPVSPHTSTPRVPVSTSTPQPTTPPQPSPSPPPPVQSTSIQTSPSPAGSPLPPANSSLPPDSTGSQSVTSNVSGSSSPPFETSGSLASSTLSHSISSSDSVSQGTSPASNNIIPSGPSSTQTSQGGVPSLIASTGSPHKRKIGGVIAGSVIAACDAIIGLVFALFCCVKRRRARAEMTMFSE